VSILENKLEQAESAKNNLLMDLRLSSDENDQLKTSLDSSNVINWNTYSKRITILCRVFQIKLGNLQTVLDQKNKTIEDARQKLAKMRQVLHSLSTELFSLKDAMLDARQAIQLELEREASLAATRLEKALDEFRILGERARRMRALNVKVVTQAFQNKFLEDTTRLSTRNGWFWVPIY